MTKLSPAQVIKKLGIPKTTLYKHMSSGEIKFEGTVGKRIIDLEQVRKFCEEKGIKLKSPQSYKERPQKRSKPSQKGSQNVHETSPERSEFMDDLREQIKGLGTQIERKDEQIKDLMNDKEMYRQRQLTQEVEKREWLIEKRELGLAIREAKQNNLPAPESAEIIDVKVSDTLKAAPTVREVRKKKSSKPKKGGLFSRWFK